MLKRMDPNPTQDEGAARQLLDGQAHLYNLTYSYVNSLSVKCAVELGIADIIHSHGRPITLPQLVSALEIQPSKTNCLRRLMRLLVHSGLFCSIKDEEAAAEEEAYALTPSSSLLIKDKSYCLSPYVAGMFHHTWFRGNIEDEMTPFKTANGTDIWDYMRQDPEFGNIFNQAMASDTQMARLVVKHCKPIFEGLSSLVDVGGGTGSFSRIIYGVFPSIICTVYDLPHVVANLQDNENLKFIAGDFFQSIPPADAILLKMILHAFGDEQCVKILKMCREAILASKSDGGKIIIVDIVINEKKDEHELTETKLLFDMLMMVHVNGKERTEKEWQGLFLDAGFSHYKITPIFGFRSFIEVFP